MNAPPPTLPAGTGIHRVRLDTGSGTLSGLLARPAQPEEPAQPPRSGGAPRPVIVAVHGRAMRADYFHGRAHPDLSLLDLAVSRGHTVLALDRPGYGESARQLPQGQTVSEQSATVHAGLRSFAAAAGAVSGFNVLAHSHGGKLALQLAADDSAGLIRALDISGCAVEYSDAARGLPSSLGAGAPRLNWGPLRLYPPGTFQQARSLLAPTPPREDGEWSLWPHQYRRIAPRVAVPVRFTFADHEAWWRLAASDLAELTGALTAAPRAEVHHQRDAGHNISLGWSARAYHLRALEFFETCA
ncbi:alpha/beta hydrolase [Streptomonospora sediminis]